MSSEERERNHEHDDSSDLQSDSAESTPTNSSEDMSDSTEKPEPTEDEIRLELGIGSDKSKSVLDAGKVEDLLSGALKGYDELLSEVEQTSQAARAAADGKTGQPIPEMGAELVDQNLELLRDVHLNVKVELGRGRMYLKDILRLGQGSVVELERLAGDPLDIYVNDKVIARGEVLVLNESFCIRITEVFNPEELKAAI